MGILGDLIVGLLLGGGHDDKPSRPVAPDAHRRPQGPGLNIGEANVRKAYGLPTRAKSTKWATSSGPGMESLHHDRPPNKSFEPKFGMAGLRQSMGLPTTGKHVKSYNRLANANLLPDPHWDPSRDLWTAGDPREQFVNRKMDKWLAPYDEEPTWSNFFTNWNAGRQKPGETQQKAFRESWEDEYDKRYGGEERNIAEKALGFTFRQDLDSDSIDKGSLAFNSALLFAPWGKGFKALKEAKAARSAGKAGAKELPDNVIRLHG